MIITTDPNTGAVTTEYKKDGKLLKSETVDKDGNKTVTEYAQDGTTVTQKTQTDKSTGTVQVTKYEDGKPSVMDETKGTNTKHYEYNGDTPILTSEVKNKGIEAKQEEITYAYDGDTCTAHVKMSGGKTIDRISVDGKVSYEAITENGKRTTIDYDENGSRTETAVSNGNTVVTDYNENDHRLTQTKVGADGKTYEAKYDGNGNTQVVVNAGESVGVIAERMSKSTGRKISEDMVYKANPSLKRGATLQAGQTINVPGELDAGSAFLNTRQTAEEAKAKGDAAERQNQSSMSRFSETEDVQITKGQYKSYEDYARSVLESEGVDVSSKPQLVKDFAAKIKNMNGGKDISSLDAIKSPISPERKEQKARLEAQRKDATAQADIQKAREQGRAIAKDVHTAVKGVGTNQVLLGSAISKLSTDNAAHAVIAYREQSNDHEGICSAITGEYALTNGAISQQRNDVKNIYDKLEAKAKSLGIDTSEYHTKFYGGGNDRGALARLKGSELDSIVENLAAKIAAKESLSTEDRTGIASQGSDVQHSETIETLSQITEDAAHSLQEQLDYDGWAGKCADACGHATTLFNGKKNYESAVRHDIEQYNKDIESLQGLKSPQFEARFKEIFGVDYDPELIRAYQNTKQEWAKVDAAHTQMKLFENDNSNLLEYKEGDKVSSGIYRNVDDKIRTEMTTLAKEMKLEEFKPYLYGSNPTNIQNAFIDYIGDDAIKAKYGPDMDWSKASNEQRYTVLSEIAKKYDQSLQEDFNTKSNGKTYSECKTQAQYSYKAAFGTSNNIAARVEDYNHSQMVGGEVIKTTVKAGFVAGTALTGGGLAAGAAVTFAAGVLVDGSDVAVSQSRKLDEDTIKEILTDNALNAGSYLAGGTLGEALQDASAFIRITGSALGNVAIGTGAEAMKGGEVTVEGVCIKVVFSAAGELVGLSASKVEDAVVNSGKSMMRSGTSKTVAKATTMAAKYAVKGAENAIELGVSSVQDAVEAEMGA